MWFIGHKLLAILQFTQEYPCCACKGLVLHRGWYSLVHIQIILLLNDCHYWEVNKMVQAVLVKDLFVLQCIVLDIIPNIQGWGTVLHAYISTICCLYKTPVHIQQIQDTTYFNTVIFHYFWSQLLVVSEIKTLCICLLTVSCTHTHTYHSVHNIS